MAKHRQPFLNNDVIRLVELNKEPEQKLWIGVLAKAFDEKKNVRQSNRKRSIDSW